MTKLKLLVCVAAFAVLGICIYSFLGGNEVFDGKFKNDHTALRLFLFHEKSEFLLGDLG